MANKRIRKKRLTQSKQTEKPLSLYHKRQRFKEFAQLRAYAESLGLLEEFNGIAAVDNIIANYKASVKRKTILLDERYNGFVTNEDVIKQMTEEQIVDFFDACDDLYNNGRHRSRSIFKSWRKITTASTPSKYPAEIYALNEAYTGGFLKNAPARVLVAFVREFITDNFSDELSRYRQQQLEDYLEEMGEILS